MKKRIFAACRSAVIVSAVILFITAAGLAAAFYFLLPAPRILPLYQEISLEEDEEGGYEAFSLTYVTNVGDPRRIRSIAFDDNPDHNLWAVNDSAWEDFVFEEEQDTGVYKNRGPYTVKKETFAVDGSFKTDLEKRGTPFVLSECTVSLDNGRKITVDLGKIVVHPFGGNWTEPNRYGEFTTVCQMPFRDVLSRVKKGGEQND